MMKYLLSLVLFITTFYFYTDFSFSQQRKTPARVRLLSEKAPDGKKCGKWIELKYQACKAVKSCKNKNISTSYISELTDLIQQKVNKKTSKTCDALSCSIKKIRNDKNHFECKNPKKLCMTRTLEHTCIPKRTAKKIGKKKTLTSKPKRVSPTKKPVQVNPNIGKIDKFGIEDPGDGVIPAGVNDLVSNVNKCVDPKVETPPHFKAPTTNDPKEGGLDLGFRAKTSTGYAVKFNNTNKLATSSNTQQASNSCVSYSDDQFFGNGNVPDNMPAINFPEIDCEGLHRCIKARLGWMQGHHHLWRARQMIHTIAAEDKKWKRGYLWNQPGADKDGKKLSEKTSPAYWFGPYEDYRLYAIKQALDKVWNIFTSNKTGGLTLKLRCPDVHLNPANVCYSDKKPSAHHWVKGTVDLCGGYFNGDGIGSQWFRAETTIHELLHHLFLTYSHNGPKLVAIQDIHTHGHGTACLGNVKTHAHYGEDNVRHLATYRRTGGKRCGHLERNIRNNDTYALFAATIGYYVYSGAMIEWPAPSQPTPQAPTDCDTGDEGCYCEGTNSWPANEYFEPDGDFAEDKWCDDNDGEMTCVKTAFGTGNNKGICKKCDDLRGPGCECSNTQPCQVGSCFGDDTYGNGVGHCFKDPPPDWACLADCKKLFNSSSAWCYYDYPTGKARCMDHICTKPEAYSCHVDQDGKVCFDGDCVVECNSNNDCQTKGYPSNFECISNRCEYAF